MGHQPIFGYIFSHLGIIPPPPPAILESISGTSSQGYLTGQSVPKEKYLGNDGESFHPASELWVKKYLKMPLFRGGVG